jgi:hypothetical protein
MGALGLSVAWVAAAVGEELVLVPRGIEGSELVVDVVARGLNKAGSFDLTVSFDASKLGAPRLENGPLTTGGMVADNLVRDGSYRIAVISAMGISGEGDLVTLRFPVRASAGDVALDLEARISDLNGVAIPSRTLGVSVRLGDAVAPEDEPSDSARAPGPDELPRVEAAYDAAAPDALEGAGDAGGGEGEGSVEELDSGSEIEIPDPRWEQEEERRRVHRAARLAGYSMRLRFDPRERIVEDSGRTPVEARLVVLKYGDSIEIDPADLKLEGSGVEVYRVRTAADGRGLELELRVDGDALPAWLEASVLGLYEQHLVPVYPRVDVDLDGSGDLTRRDYAAFVIHFGARKGQAGYEERLDILPDGRIDRNDLAAFRFNLVEAERARRLKNLESQDPSEEAAP